MRENGHQPIGLPLETAFAVLQRLNMAPSAPARCALQPLFLGDNGSMNNFEIASIYFATLWETLLICFEKPPVRRGSVISDPGQWPSDR